MHERLLNKLVQPTFEEMKEYCGENGERFSALCDWIVKTFNSTTKIVFPYGNSYGWGVVHYVKKALFCNVFAENNSFCVMIRATDKQYRSVYVQLQKRSQEIIDNYYPCNNGGWIHYRVTNELDYQDVKKILISKQLKTP